MSRTLKALTIVTLIAFEANALACFTPTRFTVDGETYDAVVVVTVSDEANATRSGLIKAKVEKVLTGPYEQRIIDLPWMVSDAKGICPSSSPFLHKGEQATVYLKRDDQPLKSRAPSGFIVAGWMPLAPVR
ncbi:hypothetical protein HRV97_02455 [Sphingomonas sp. HHU CXW]|uniref:DUF2141 domain-containing protein n=1 Tax=Sphingomonas hominis TaxID=2741495 RepID=A0ABX2JHW1_9SPHN|nr:hypothetical protein [Sphingomonas hominis]NTS64022.1 hypothetical protein [Sphingomonas hominis]